MSITIRPDVAVMQELQSRGIDKSVGVFGSHYVQLGKGSPIRLDAIKSASVPFAGFKTATKVARGFAGIRQTANDVLKTLASAKSLDAGALLGLLKAQQTHFDRLAKLDRLDAAQKQDADGMKKIFNEPIHKAAINFVGTTKNNLLVTGAADNTVKVFDMQNDFKLIGNMKSADAVFCGDICGNILAAGCGDGNLLCYNLDTMECLWGYGCEKKGGIKIVKFVPEKSKILTAGDSGQGLELCF